jgi:alpha-amylase/alpha-mannosidase (GH57 family)
MLPGLRIGHAHCIMARTGVTVLVPDCPVVMGVDVRGGGPGTRETDALEPTTLVERVHGLVLAGGSVFGLEAASELTLLMARDGIGLPVAAGLTVPVIPSAILFDLANGGDKRWARPGGGEAPYRRLARLADWVVEHPAGLDYLSDQFLIDLLVWYHLAWLGATVRRSDARAKSLIEKGGHYTLADRGMLIGLLAELMASIIPRYRRLAEAGRIELSVTPYSHPILPLMLDFNAAHEAQPQALLPLAAGYPGGLERARWQIREAIDVFRCHFGFAPAGVWPAEGGVCARTLQLLGDNGFRWAATGQGVLRNSLGVSEPVSDQLHRPYQPVGGPACFFRDDELSDRIGFQYRSWHGDDAVANLVHELEGLADEDRPPGQVVSIILDGENAWEYYPDNAYYFLSGLYSRLAAHPRLQLTTFSAVLDGLERDSIRPLERVVAGSWVYGNFAIWIGDPDKNRAWDLLVEAKRVFDRVVAEGRLNTTQRSEAERQLAHCEASDWFWWLGGDNSAANVAQFERLFRLHLAALYQMLGEPVPDQLTRPLAHGRTDGTGSAMRGGH